MLSRYIRSAHSLPRHGDGCGLACARSGAVGGRRCRLLLRRQAAPPRSVACDANQEQSTSVSTLTSVEPPAAKFEITLRGVEALQTVRLDLVPQGKGQAVVVTEVVEGSTAEQLGVRRGQKLNALSDPLRYGTMWSLEDRPSLRFVIDTFKMRRSSPIDLEFEPLLTSTDMNTFFGAPSSSGAEEEVDSAQEVEAASSAAWTVANNSSSGGGGADVSSNDALGILGSIDQVLGSGSGSDTEGETIGERLAAKHAAQQRSRMTVNQVQERIERRKAYMEIDDQRDDTGLLLGLAAAFLLPALVILVVAFYTGYLDRLYLTALT